MKKSLTLHLICLPLLLALGAGNLEGAKNGSPKREVPSPSKYGSKSKHNQPTSQGAGAGSGAGGGAGSCQDDAAKLNTEGLKYHDKRQYSRAFSLFKLAAKKGSADAQYNLGVYCQLGRGTKKNLTEAREWYVKAAEHDHLEAQFNLGTYYGGIWGDEKNLKESQNWYRKAANNGFHPAQCNLGNALLQEERFGEAMHWYMIAANQDNDKAMNNIGNMYELGQGVCPNYQEAMYWFSKAASLGNEFSIEKMKSWTHSSDSKEDASHINPPATAMLPPPPGPAIPTTPLVVQEPKPNTRPFYLKKRFMLPTALIALLLQRIFANRSVLNEKDVKKSKKALRKLNFIDRAIMRSARWLKGAS